uniref:Uncharacterized protein n=1 Tax=Rhizophagus irregularis (strain DAOM 181602 / DAOM 197198 / MUCL 43194) TaxID=747089 RepID=U9SP35_RHIID
MLILDRNFLMRLYSKMFQMKKDSLTFVKVQYYLSTSVLGINKEIMMLTLTKHKTAFETISKMVKSANPRIQGVPDTEYFYDEMDENEADNIRSNLDHCNLFEFLFEFHP